LDAATHNNRRSRQRHAETSRGVLREQEPLPQQPAKGERLMA